MLLACLEAELGEVWVAECDEGASIEPLPPSQAGSGREMSSLPRTELPIKKYKHNLQKLQTPNLVEILMKIYIKFQYTRGNFL